MTNYVCSDCGRTFKRKENMINHQKKMVCQNKKYRCDKCKSSFTSKNNLYRNRKHTCTYTNSDSKNDSKSNGDDYDKTEILRKFAEMENRMKNLEMENEKLRTNNCNGPINNGVINHNVHNGDVINNYVLVGYGKED